MHKDSPELVLVMPAYNEEEDIANVVKQWIEVLRNVVGPDKFKMLVIDDGSQDKTFEILKQLERDIPELIVDTHSNRGHGPTMLKVIVRLLKWEPDGLLRQIATTQFRQLSL